MHKVNVLGTDIGNLTKDEAIKKIDTLVQSKKPHQIVTVNAEFLVASQHDGDFRTVLETSSLNLADSIGILWAAKFLSLPPAKNNFFQWVQIGTQFKKTILSILFYPSYIRSVIKEKIPGSDLVWDIAKLAAEKKYSIFILGGFNDTPDLVSKKLCQKNPNLNIVGTYSGQPSDRGIVEKISKEKPDILLVAFGPVIQEKWIAKNLEKLGVSVAIGLGGTFDYIAGKKPAPPRFLRYIGLEWAFRLITQPHRIKRIMTAIFVFPWTCVRYRIMTQKPYRKNVVACVLNEKKQILICRRIIDTKEEKKFFGLRPHWQFPQGGVDEGENEEQAVKRELFEEIGVNEFKILKKIENANHYDWPINLSNETYNGKYRGQSQTLFIIKINSNNPSIKLDKKEFDDHRWVDQNVLFDTLHPMRKNLAKIAINHINNVKS